MKAIIQNLLSVFGFASFVIISLNISVAHAEEIIVTLEEGEAAPFDGTLFNTAAAASLAAEIDASRVLCNLTCATLVAQREAELQLELNLIVASRDRIASEYEQVLQIKNDQVDFLQKQVQKPRFPFETVFILGLVSGVGLTLAAAYSLNQVAAN